MITHRSPGSVKNIQDAIRVLTDLETERQQVIAALNIMLTASPAGQLLLPITDDSGVPAMYRLVAGAGVTITFNTVNKTCTISSP
jgi:hypothetical protein